MRLDHTLLGILPRGQQGYNAPRAHFQYGRLHVTRLALHELHKTQYDLVAPVGEVIEHVLERGEGQSKSEGMQYVSKLYRYFAKGNVDM